MRLVVVGPGALGCLVAARLAPVACSGLVLLDHRPERARLIERQGLILDEEGHSRRVELAVSAEPAGLGQAEVVLLCVKAPALPQTLRCISPLCGPGTLLVLLQNGIAHLETAAPAGTGIAFGVSAEGATLVAPGHVRHAGRGETCFGFLGEATAAERRTLEQVAVCWCRAGFEARVCDDIRQRIWAKLLVNVAINALSAIHGRSNGQLLVSCALRPRMVEAVREAAAVAAAAGVVTPANPMALVAQVCRATSRNLSSMLQDVCNQRPTEIEAINGAVVALGRSYGVATPVNERLLAQVKAMEAAYKNTGAVPCAALPAEIVPHV
ncbi:MAG: hypothetical protein BWK76_20275 [Desulfobulbaceae bacterium A2]|nr:MAG: hypothetical protein BWK76_20275 [Desulfobulbaceae bacterium A2]